METKVDRDIRQHISGSWCIVQDGFWYPFGNSREWLVSYQHSLPSDLAESATLFAYESETGLDRVFPGEQIDKNPDPYSDYVSEKSLSELTEKFYSKSFVQNLKANTKSLNFYTYAPMPPQYAVITEPTPEPPKKAMPKAVPDTNGRKFRDEE